MADEIMTEKYFENIRSKLMAIQRYLKAPKGQFNSFGKYSYRNCEDILEALKPIMQTMETSLIVSDEIVLIGDRYYVKATATLYNNSKDESLSATAYAREDESKKGMDLSQLTGSTSSYARKYALNGLFAIDDTKDADTTNEHGKQEPTTNNKYKPNANQTKAITENQIKRLYAISNSAGVNADTVKAAVKQKMNKEVAVLTRKEYDLVVAGYEKLKESKGD